MTMGRENVDGSTPMAVTTMIQSDLEHVETVLEGSAVLEVSGNGLHSSTSTRGEGGGQAVFNSIRTTLQSIRARLVQSSPPSSLLERLRNAELAHSTRIPLSMLQREQSRRASLSELPPALSTPTVSSSIQALFARIPEYRREPSSLFASRNSERRAQESHTDRRWHSHAGVLSSSTSHLIDTDDDDANPVGSPPKETWKKQRTQHLDPSTSGQSQQDSPDEEIPILLSQNSKLHATHRAILFSSFHSSAADSAMEVTTQTQTDSSTMPHSPTLVYSWGVAAPATQDDDSFYSLHETKQLTQLPTLVASTCRMGRRNLVHMDAGPFHMACCTKQGQVWACGSNQTRAVDPDSDQPNIPRLVMCESLGMARIVQVSCGYDHTAALRSNGTVLTWGSNSYGQLGHRQFNMVVANNDNNDTQLEIHRPAVLALEHHRATSVACGDGFTLVLTSRMGLWACGVQTIAGPPPCARGNESVLLSPILEHLPLVSVAAGRHHAVAITAHGSAFAWGKNEHGVCGREYPKVLHVPVPVRIKSAMTRSCNSTTQTAEVFEPLSKWNRCRPGPTSSALTTTTTTLSPSLEDSVAIVDAACGDHHTVFVARSGQLWVCGSNHQGQLGLSTDDRTTVCPVESVAPLGPPFVSAQAGHCHTLLLDAIGNVYQFPSLDGTSPLQPILNDKSIQWIAAGGTQSMAVRANPDLLNETEETNDSVSDCSSSVSLAPNVEELLSALPSEQPEDSEAASKLAMRLEELLRAPAVLNGLFLDPTELEDIFGKLVHTGSANFRKTIALAIERGMHRGLETVGGARLMYAEQVRFLLLYLQCPLFVEWEQDEFRFDRRGDLILMLCETILELPYEGYRALLSWIKLVYPRDLLVRLLLRPLLAQLDKALSVSAGAERRPIPGLVAVLRWIYNACVKMQPIVGREEFYSQVISEMDPRLLFDDLMRFKSATKNHRVGEFFLCEHPFLFPPDTKRKLLQIENEVNMMKIAMEGMTYNIEESTYEISPFYVFKIRRDHLLSDALERISKAEPSDLRKKLRVVFEGEEGVDAGGVTREFFMLLSALLFDINTGMWSTSFEEGQVTWFNSDCTWKDQDYYLVGILVGMAVYNGVLLDVHFPPAVYCKLLGLPLGIEDVVDDDVKSNLQKLLDYQGDDVEDVFCLSFDVDWVDLGEKKRRELKLGGSNIPVTSDNREEYVMLYVKWLLSDSVYPQYDAFERGFLHVMGNSSFDDLLLPEELELLVVGTPELDFDALEKSTEYEGGYSVDSDTVRNFWKFVKSADRDTQLKLLQFATGSRKAPIGGLGCLSFKIQRAGPDSVQLPTSHTCFNTLLLPDYGSNYEKLAERLGRAILECEGFGLQ